MRNYIFSILIIFLIIPLSAQKNPNIDLRFTTAGKILSHPVIYDNIVYFGSNDNYFYAFNTKTKKLKWKFKTNAPVRSKAIIKKNAIYFNSGDDIFALNKNTCKELWSFKSNSEDKKVQTDYWDYHDGSPVVYKSGIYFGLSTGQIIGFDLQSGNVNKQFYSRDSATIKCGLHIDNGILYFADWNGKVYAYYIEKEKIIWVYETYDKKLYDTFGQINTQLSVYKDLLIFGGRNPKLQILDINTGELKWSYTEKEGGWISGDPLVVNDTLYIGGSDNHEMFAFNVLTGEKLWTYEFLFNNFSKPIAYKNYLLFTVGDAYSVFGASKGKGYLYAVNRTTGKLVNASLIGGNTYTSPIITGNMLIIGSEDHSLYMIDLNVFLNEPIDIMSKGYGSFELKEISPNPFIDKLKIDFKLIYPVNLDIKITDLNDKKVADVFFGMTEPGDYSVVWDTNTLKKQIEPGYYFVELCAGECYQKFIVQKKEVTEKK